MNQKRKLKILLSKYTGRHIGTIQRYFAGSQGAGRVVAEKMERLTGIKQLYWKYPNEFEIMPWHYCIYKIGETIDKLEEMKYRI